MTNNDMEYIVDAKHKANVETIDITFDKPYMFLIKDKNSGEVWFTGTVYEPLLYEEDATRLME